MAKTMEEHEDLVRRLQALGTEPLSPATAHGALARAMSTSPLRSRRAGLRMKVAAATAGCVLFGSAGLAAAGTLPTSVQDAAHKALGAVGVHVPVGTERFNDPALCPGGPYKNHGQYVKAHPDDPKAAHSPCGKPLQSVHSTTTVAGKTTTSTTEGENGKGHTKTTKGNSSDTAPGHSDTTKVHGPPSTKKSTPADSHGPDTTHPNSTHPTGPPSGTASK
jgi:hypothetical protein